MKFACFAAASATTANSHTYKTVTLVYVAIAQKYTGVKCNETDQASSQRAFFPLILLAVGLFCSPVNVACI